MLDPVLQPDQFMLQPEQLAEIDLAVERLFGGFRHALGDQFVEPVLLHLHLQFLVETVGDFFLDAAEFVSLAVVHGAGSVVGVQGTGFCNSDVTRAERSG